MTNHLTKGQKHARKIVGGYKGKTIAAVKEPNPGDGNRIRFFGVTKKQWVSLGTTSGLSTIQARNEILHAGKTPFPLNPR
jgi:hypothetical protein